MFKLISKIFAPKSTMPKRGLPRGARLYSAPVRPAALGHGVNR